MPHYTVIINVPNGQPIEGVVSATTIDQAIVTARKMGHDIDEEATRKLAIADTGGPGRSAAIVSAVLAISGGWYRVEIGLAAIILAVIAIELSQGRRGLPALTLSFISTTAGIAFPLWHWYRDQC